MKTKKKTFRVTGMLYPATGWEDGYLDCVGSLDFDTLKAAKKSAKKDFCAGGYGANGWFDAPKPSIEVVIS